MLTAFIDLDLGKTLVSVLQSERKTLWLIVLASLLVRGGISWFNHSALSADPDAYRAIAQTLADSGVLGLTGADGESRPTAFRPPLYPYLLAWITTNQGLSNFAVAGLHCVLGTITTVCTFLAARRLLGDRQHCRAGVTAAGLVLVDPILLQQSTLVMTETLAAALVSVTIWWWACHCRRRTIGQAVVLGTVLSAAYLCRPTFLVWAVMVVGLVPWIQWPAGGVTLSRSRRFGFAAAVGLVVLVTLGLWTLRNVRAMGHPIWATTHGGYTLLLGNNPSFYDYLREAEAGVAWDPGPFFLAYSHRYDGDPNSEGFWQTDWEVPGTIVTAVTEREDDQVAYQAARATIDRQPGWFLWSCVVRVGRLWTPLPHRTPERSGIKVMLVGGYYAFFYLAVFVGLWRIGWREILRKWWPVWTLAVTLTLVHAVYWSNIRMRAPVIPGLAMVAAACGRRTEKQCSEHGGENS